MDKRKTDSPMDADEPHLEGLGDKLYLALRLREQKQVDKAAEVLRSILKVEPRLAEPRLELARLLLDTSQLDEARAETEEAIHILETGGQWTDEIPENVLSSMAYGLLGEIIRRQADADEIVFGDPESWSKLLAASEVAFSKARALDPDNDHADYWSSGTDSPATE
jgi:tetratricopeptide (TPR) repeat protein